MDLDAYVATVTAQLDATAALGDDRTREVAAALAASAAGSIRLAAFRAVAATVDEVNAALLAGDAGSDRSVSVHFEQDEPVIRIHQPPHAGVGPGPGDTVDDGEASARISLRLSEVLKADIDAAAAAAGVSANTWLVRAARAARRPADGARTARSGHHIRGWVTG